MMVSSSRARQRARARCRLLPTTAILHRRNASDEQSSPSAPRPSPFPGDDVRALSGPPHARRPAVPPPQGLAVPPSPCPVSVPNAHQHPSLPPSPLAPPASPPTARLARPDSRSPLPSPSFSPSLSSAHAAFLPSLPRASSARSTPPHAPPSHLHPPPPSPTLGMASVNKKQPRRPNDPASGSAPPGGGASVPLR